MHGQKMSIVAQYMRRYADGTCSQGHTVRDSKPWHLQQFSKRFGDLHPPILTNPRGTRTISLSSSLKGGLNAAGHRMAHAPMLLATVALWMLSCCAAEASSSSVRPASQMTACSICMWAAAMAARCLQPQAQACKVEFGATRLQEAGACSCAPGWLCGAWLQALTQLPSLKQGNAGGLQGWLPPLHHGRQRMVPCCLPVHTAAGCRVQTPQGHLSLAYHDVCQLEGTRAQAGFAKV